MTSRNGPFARTLAAALMLALLTGCRSWQPSTMGLETLIPVERPSSVRITRSDGSIFTVQEPIMRNDSIMPVQETEPGVPASDIRLVEVQRFSGRKTFMFIIGGIFLAKTWSEAVGTPGGSQGTGLPNPDHLTGRS